MARYEESKAKFLKQIVDEKRADFLIVSRMRKQIKKHSINGIYKLE